MELIAKRLRNTTIIGVGHRPELEALYDRRSAAMMARA
jgi:hypothetical protein